MLEQELESFDDTAEHDALMAEEMAYYKAEYDREKRNKEDDYDGVQFCKHCNSEIDNTLDNGSCTECWVTACEYRLDIERDR